MSKALVIYRLQPQISQKIRLGQSSSLIFPPAQEASSEARRLISPSLILEVAKEYGSKYNYHVPVVVAGGIYDSKDMEHALKLGADAFHSIDQCIGDTIGYLCRIAFFQALTAIPGRSGICRTRFLFFLFFRLANKRIAYCPPRHPYRTLHQHDILFLRLNICLFVCLL